MIDPLTLLLCTGLLIPVLFVAILMWLVHVTLNPHREG